MSNERTPWDGFAEAALTGQMLAYAQNHGATPGGAISELASEAAFFADAMLAEREKRFGGEAGGVNAELLVAVHSLIGTLDRAAPGVFSSEIDDIKSAIAKATT